MLREALVAYKQLYIKCSIHLLGIPGFLAHPLEILGI
jgi:hypothetical protein